MDIRRFEGSFGAVAEDTPNFPTHIFLHPGFAESAGGTFGNFKKTLERNGFEKHVHGIEQAPPMGSTERDALMAETRNEARAWYRENRSDTNPEHIEAILASIPPTLFEKALAVRRAIEEDIPPGDTLVIYGHSQGAAAVAWAAALFPQYFSGRQAGVILSNPSGLTGREGIAPSKVAHAAGKVLTARLHTLLEFPGDLARQVSVMVRYASGAVRAFVRHAAKPGILSATFGGLVYSFRHDLSHRTEEEANDMANTDLLPVLELIAGSGVRVTVVYDEDDLLFPAKKIETRLDGHPSIELVKTKGGGHFHPLTKTDEAANILKERAR